MKSFSVFDAFSSPGCTKGSKFERVVIVQTHTHDGKNGRFFWFFQKKTVIYTKLLFFLEKSKKSSIFPIMIVCLNNHNSFKFGAFGTTRGWKSIKNTETFHFFEKKF